MAVALLTAFICATAFADEAKKPAVLPDRSEVWVPASKLKDILAKHPNAVVLSREQYETLLRGSATERKQQPAAPRRAALTSANYQARIVKKVAHITGSLVVNVLSDEWAQLPLDFGGVSIGTVTIDGEAAFIAHGVAAADSTKKVAQQISTSALLLRGKGARVVTIEFTIPLTVETGVSRIQIKLPSAAAGVFVLDLPPNQRVESPRPVSVKKSADSTIVSAGLTPANPTLELTWRGAADTEKALAPLVLANGIYSIDAEKVRAEYGMSVETQLGSLPAAFQIALPANAKVLQVTGDELAKWEAAGGVLKITLQSGERPKASFWLALETPSLAAAASAKLTLPVPRIDGLARMQGVFSIVGDAGVTVKDVATDSATQPTERACGPVPHFVASYKFLTPPGTPAVTVERVQPRFSADLDTLAEFRSDAIFIERTVTLHFEKGEVFQTAVALPPGEEVLTVRDGADAEPDWRIEAGKVRLRWSDTGEKTAPRVFKIRTRIEPEKWTQIGTDGITFALGDAKIEGAEKVTGYIALKADDAFRLEAAPSETLERRDGRTTPVQGDYAWFRRAEFSLTVKVAKRPGEVLASLTGYALPLEGVLDLHAQMNFQFLYSGARSVRIRVPKAIANNFNFDGPQIAERNLADDVWTIVFQKELTGAYGLKITAQVAVEKQAADAAPAAEADSTGIREARFAISVPVITPLDAVRTGGTWAIEANTETEITFDAKGMNELDSLLAPWLPDYAPRHRVIGVFAWLGPDYALALSGVRHAAATMLTSVVDSLALDTVVSTSGIERDQAVFQLRTAGAQYLDIELPEKSRMLSLTVDNDLVKPVGDRADQVRVQLPAKRDASSAIAVSLLYETPKSEWHRAGWYTARAPRLAKNIPILRSEWRLHLPDGFEYSDIESNLRVPEQTLDAPLVASAFRGAAAVFMPPVFGSIRTRRATASPGTPVPATPAPPASVPQINTAWANPVRRFNVDEATARGNSAIQRKLEKIVIPRVELREATIAEALSFLRTKSVELDPGEPKTGVNFQVQFDETPLANARITISLSNIPLGEALRYVTALVNLKVKVEPYAVSIVPASVNTDVLITKEWRIRPGLIPNVPGGAMADREKAKDWLVSNGVQFNGAASAILIAASNRLIVRNTQDQLDLIDTILTPAEMGGVRTKGFGDEVDAYQQRISGLLPMKIELPKVGRLIVLEGLSGAERVEFRYDDWWSRARRLWLWFVAGGLVCLFIARERPWWRTCWAVLVLSFLPLVVTVSAMAVCNALLAGWLASVVLQRFAVRVVFAPRRKEVLA